MYMHHSEGCTCVVQIIDRDQGVRMKRPARLRYTGPLAAEKYHKLETRFTEMFRTANHEHMQKLSKIGVKSSSSLNIKVFALCWEALSEAVQLRNYELAESCSKGLGRKHQNLSLKTAYSWKEEL